MPIALSTTPTPPITSGPRLISGHNPASSSPATTPTIAAVTVGTSGPVARVSQTATPVVGTTAATVGQAVQGVTGVVGTVTGTVRAVTSTVGAVTGTVGAVTGTVGAAAGTVGAVTNTVGVTASVAESAAATVSISDLAGNGSSQPAVSLPVSVPGLG
jgi:hypothetical protein